MGKSNYFFSDDVFVCRWDFHWIILDLVRDKYLCVPKAEFDLILPFLQGWTNSNHGEWQSSSMSRDGQFLASQLLKQGILTEDYARANKTSTVQIPNATRTMWIPRRPLSAWKLTVHALPFYLAAATADYRLRHWSFCNVVKSVQRIKPTNSGGDTAFDYESVQQLVSIFNSLRPIYPRDYLCLFDSLALLVFLARYGVYPLWVFGVSADPFYAHCWVQEEHSLLNDTIERTRKYRPIMVV